MLLRPCPVVFKQNWLGPLSQFLPALPSRDARGSGYAATPPNIGGIGGGVYVE